MRAMIMLQRGHDVVMQLCFENMENVNLQKVFLRMPKTG